MISTNSEGIAPIAKELGLGTPKIGFYALTTPQIDSRIAEIGAWHCTGHENNFHPNF